MNNHTTYSYSQKQNIPQSILNAVNFNDQTRSAQDRNENYPFFQQNKIDTIKYYTRNQPSYYTANYSPSDDEKYYNQNQQRFYTSQRPRSYSNDQQTLSNHTHVMNMHDTQEINQEHTKIFFNHKTQSINNLINQLKCLKKFH